MGAIYTPLNQAMILTKALCMWESLYVFKNKDWASPVALAGKNLPAKAGDTVWFLGQQEILEEEMATHSNILAWKIPWTEETGWLQSMGLLSQIWLSTFACTWIWWNSKRKCFQLAWRNFGHIKGELGCISNIRDQGKLQVTSQETPDLRSLYDSC